MRSPRTKSRTRECFATRAFIGHHFGLKTALIEQGAHQHESKKGAMSLPISQSEPGSHPP